MKLIKISVYTILVILLTLLTQIGGITFLLSLPVAGFINRRVPSRWKRIAAKVSFFLVLYLICVFIVVPIIARSLGRVPLPVFEKNHLKPANILTSLLNRNYVRPELREIAFQVAMEMSRKYPGTTINYLDANFPFIDKFPLLPHRSHQDGRKLDISFQYNDSKTDKPTNEVPSFIGYGICEGPKASEENMPAHCNTQGYWQYSMLEKTVSQSNKARFKFDEERTRSLINAFAKSDSIAWIFIEPHLKKRLRLSSNKIVFHGCQAVRHDDHLHVQVK